MGEAGNSVFVEVCSPDHRATLMNGLWKAVLNRNKTDLTFKVGQRSIHAHKMIVDIFLPLKPIDAASAVDSEHNYAAKLSYGDRLEQDNYERGICKDPMDALVEFMYHGAVTIRREQLGKLRRLARSLKFRLLVDAVNTAIQSMNHRPQNLKISDVRSCSSEESQTPPPPPVNPIRLCDAIGQKYCFNESHDDSVDGGSDMSDEFDQDEPSESSGVPPATAAPPHVNQVGAVSFPHQSVASNLNASLSNQAGKRKQAIVSLLAMPQTIKESAVKFAGKTYLKEGNVRKTAAVLAKVNQRSPKLFTTPTIGTTIVTSSEIVGASTTPDNDETDNWSLVASSNGNDDQADVDYTPVINRTLSMFIGPKLKCQFCSFLTVNYLSLRPHIRQEHPDQHKRLARVRRTETRRLCRDTIFNSDPSTLRLYQCRHCDFRTIKASVLSLHEAKHDPVAGLSTFPCTHCGTKFVLEAHLRHHTCNGGQCPHCAFRCRGMPGYLRHLARHGPDGTFWPCDLCPKTFPDQAALTSHKQTHEFLYCPRCEFTSRNRHLFRQHRVKVHGIKLGEKLKAQPSACLHPECDERFPSKMRMYRHIKEAHPGSKLFRCDECDKCHSECSSLRLHVRAVHRRDERKLVCEICGYITSMPNRLRRHMEGHSDVRPHECDQCKVRFKTRASWRAHMKRHVRNDKPHVCHICGHSTNKLFNLGVHMRIHTRDKPFKCNLCSMAFSQNQVLKQHLRIHVNKTMKNHGIVRQDQRSRLSEAMPERERYTCDVCQKVTLGRRNHLVHLRRHRQAITPPVLKHGCPECHKSFGRRGNLKIHLQNTHGREDCAGLAMDDTEVTFPVIQLPLAHIIQDDVSTLW